MPAKVTKRTAKDAELSSHDQDNSSNSDVQEVTTEKGKQKKSKPPRSKKQRLRLPSQSPSIEELVPTTAPSTATAPTTAAGSSRPTTAHDVWEFFTKGDAAKKLKTTCNICGPKLLTNPVALKGIVYDYAVTTSNPNLRLHLEKYHEKEYVEKCKQMGWKNLLPKAKAIEKLGQQSTLDGSLRPGPSGRSSFSQVALTNQLINFIVADDQSLRVVENPEFRKLLLLLREDLQDSDIPRRTKIRQEILREWEHQFKRSRQEMSSALGKISFTADIWSDQNLRPYLAITAHYLIRDDRTRHIVLRVTLIAFHHIAGHHDGFSLAKVTLKLLDRAGVTAKVGHWTLDNASNNGTFMSELELLLKKREIEFHHHENRISCFPHIINICCSHIIDEFTAPESFAEFVPSNRTLDEANQTYLEARKRDPIALGRGVIRNMRSSGLRREHLREIIIDGNLKGRFKVKGKKVTLPEVQLLRDVRTRWDSVFYMIRRLRVLRPAVETFLSHPDNKDLAKHQLSTVEWAVLADFELILEVPHRVQQSMSKETTPILSGAIPAFELFMMRWEQLAKKAAHLKPMIDVGLQYAAKYYEQERANAKHGITRF